MNEFSNAVFKDWSPAGKTLVEASAGTGKTYNIQNVYLRLVLQGLSVQQILVVTFTKAATAELRQRLRSVLADCRNQLLQPSPTCEPRLADALAQARASNPDDEALRRTIHLALMDFDAAAIFTIHGFCKRVLERYAFECGHDPDAELMVEQRRIVLETCQDWWRQNAYSAALPILPFAKLSDLVELVLERSRHPDADLVAPPPMPPGAFGELINTCKVFSKQFGQLRGTFSWTSSANFTAGKNGPPIDASPVFDVVHLHAPSFRNWLAAQSPTDASPSAAAFATVLQAAFGTPASGDAKPFAGAVREVANDGEKHLRLSHQAPVVDALAADARQRVRDRAALTYDAMLLNVREVLRDADAGPRLKAVLRDEFKAALIDEFQDTDPVQYGIFSAIFADGQSPPPPLLYVGDPKQAIYGFRSGDVFTYLDARRAVDMAQAYSLGTNYRSEPHLVAAVNELFGDASPGSTFANSDIPYPGDLLANPAAKDDKILYVRGVPDDKPLKLWSIPSEKSAAIDCPAALDAYDRVAQECAALFDDDSLRFGSGAKARRVRPGDVAVLVVAHQEAEMAQRALLALGINAVRQSNGNVFQTDEAAQIALVLRAMVAPTDGKSVRGALCADLLPCALDRVAAFNADSAVPPADADDASSRSFEEWIDLFRSAGQTWRERSFIEAFNAFADRVGLRVHLLGLPDGNRRLANVLHLAEELHHAAREQHLSPEALIRWFADQQDAERRDEADETDSAKTRIAQDDDAVQIMTIFKSKGLEFPIVFMPSLWRRAAKSSSSKSKMLKYHDNGRLVQDIDTANPVGKRAAEAESHQENVRLAYVALTRAVNRTYLVELQSAKLSPASHALSHLLAAWRKRRADNPSAPSHVEASAPPPEFEPVKWNGPVRPDPATLASLPPPNVEKSRGHASFSSLAPHGSAHNASPRDVDAADAPPAADDEPSSPPPPIFAIPGGAKLGSCWHEVFEHADFTASAEEIDRLVDETLDRYNLCKAPADELPDHVNLERTQRRNAVRQMVRDVIHAPLRSDSDAFSLRDVPLSARKSELEFQFSLHRDAGHRVGDLADILNRHWRSEGRDEAFIRDLAAKERAIPRGFMTGFIDLVFQRNGRFYVVDWKSNQLNRDPSGFEKDGLAAEMRAKSYYLQYLIYLVALHGFLASRLADYDYDRHVGGAFYLFLRGIQPDSPRGIFHDRPPKALVEALADYLGGPP
jgi:exodeoxyribonuclease V beta subunit